MAFTVPITNVPWPQIWVHVLPVTQDKGSCPEVSANALDCGESKVHHPLKNIFNIEL